MRRAAGSPSWSGKSELGRAHSDARGGGIGPGNHSRNLKYCLRKSSASGRASRIKNLANIRWVKNPLQPLFSVSFLARFMQLIVTRVSQGARGRPK
jgi:hypothetical protein